MLPEIDGEVLDGERVDGRPGGNRSRDPGRRGHPRECGPGFRDGRRRILFVTGHRRYHLAPWLKRSRVRTRTLTLMAAIRRSKTSPPGHAWRFRAAEGGVGEQEIR